MTINSPLSRSRRLGLALALALSIAFACSFAAGADAAVYSVSNGAALQNALDLAAASTATADEVKLAPGIYERDGGFKYDGGPNAGNHIAITGTPGETVLQTPSATTDTYLQTLRVRGSGSATSVVSGLKVRMPLGVNEFSSPVGLTIEDALAVNVVVEPRAATGERAGTGIKLLHGGHVRAARVTMAHTNFLGIAIEAFGTELLVEDVQTVGGQGIVFEGTGGGRVTRARVDVRQGPGAGVTCFACEGLGVDDTVVRLAEGGQGLRAISDPNHVVVLDASHVTVVGDGSASATAVEAIGAPAMPATVVRLDNCVLDGVGHTLARTAYSGSSASIVTRNCNYPSQKEAAEGAGTIDAQAHTSADPGFIYPYGGDFRLRWSSPLVDAGRTAGLFVDSPLTLDRAIRIVDGNLDGDAKPDLGAYEYQALAPRISIQPISSPRAGEPFTLDASKSWGGDPGEPVSYKWVLPGGATAVTPTVGLNLPSGTHNVALTVTDPTGKTATETRTVTVEPAAPKPSAVAPLLSGVRVSPALVRRGSAPRLRLALGRPAAVTARVQRRAGGHWRLVRRVRRTLAAGSRRIRLPRARRAGKWRVVVTARAGTASATARARYRVRR